MNKILNVFTSSIRTPMFILNIHSNAYFLKEADMKSSEYSSVLKITKIRKNNIYQRGKALFPCVNMYIYFVMIYA